MKGTYAWVRQLVAAERLPIASPALLDWIQARPESRQAPRERPNGANITAYVNAALEGEYSRVSSALEGRRNITLNAAAFSLGQFVGAGVLTEVDAVDALRHAAATCGLDDHEADRTIRSGLKAGKRNPRALT